MQNPLKRIRLVFRRSSPKLKILVILALVVCTVTLLALSVKIRQTRDNTQALAQEGAALEQENQALTEDIGDLGTIKSIKDLARRF